MLDYRKTHQTATIECDYPHCKEMESFTGQRPACIDQARAAGWYTANVQITKIKREWRHFCPGHRLSWKDLKYDEW